MASKVRKEDWRRATVIEVGDTINILGSSFKIDKLLGKGKGGYSFLARAEDSRPYTLKLFHNEVVPYYSFSRDKLSLELEAYSFLRSNGFSVPRLLYWDSERNFILKEYVEGDTVEKNVMDGKDVSNLFSIVDEMQEKSRALGYNLDWFPSNFIVSEGSVIYIDYEVNPYDERWSFRRWGIEYWKNRDALLSLKKCY